MSRVPEPLRRSKRPVALGLLALLAIPAAGGAQVPPQAPATGSAEAQPVAPAAGDASRNAARSRLHECGHQWSLMKANGKAAGMTWKDYSRGCLVKP